MQTKNRLLVVMAVLAFSFAFQPSKAQQVPSPSQSTMSAGSLTHEQGWAAYQRQNYKLAFDIFQRLARQGDTDAQVNLGFMYSIGEGVPKDYAAASWSRRAAEKGHAKAQGNLAYMYITGQGVAQDDA